MYYWFILLSSISVCVLIYFFQNKNSFHKDIKIIINFLLVGFVFSKLFNSIEIIFVNSFDFSDLFRIFLYNSGHRTYGALVGGYIVLYTSKISMTSLNIITKLICLGFSMGYLSCLIQGHGCYGIETNLPWGMNFHWGSTPSPVKVHPTPLYNSLGFLFIFLVLHFRVKNMFHYHLINMFLLLSSIQLFLIDFIRPINKVLFIFTFGQLIYMLIFFWIFFYFTTISNFLKT